MNRVRGLLPADSLGRTRLAAVIVGCLALCSALAQSGSPANTPLWNSLGVLSILLIMGALVGTHLRGRAPWWDSVTLPVLIAIGGSGLRDPLSTMALALAMTLVLSLYGPTWLWLVRAIGAFLAVPAAIIINPISLGREVSWHSATVLSVVPQLALISVMMRGIYLAALRREQTGARDAVLARTGARMIGATDVENVRALGKAAGEELVALSPGVAMVVVRRSPTGLVVHNVAGLSEELRGRPLPEDVLRRPALMAGHVTGFPHWEKETFSDDLHLFVGGVDRLSPDVVDAFRTAFNQVVLAEAAVLSHAELDHQANHDHLTKLPTRAKFFRRLAAAVDEHPPGTVALLNIDLDDFKTINDTYGHAVGDELLVEVAARLEDLDRPGTVAARFGGDEFAVLLTGLEHPEAADRIAGRLSRRLIQPQRLTSATVTVGASIGVAVSAPGYTAADLCRCADIAMYSAKAQGKNRVERFDPARHGDIARHRTLEHHLGDAIARDEITLRFVPWVDPQTGRCVGVEALAHWVHPSFGTLGPADLIRLAGHTGDLPALSRHVLRAACTQISAVPDSTRLRVGLGVTARQLQDSTFGAGLLQIAAGAGVDPARLTLEIVDADGLGAGPRPAPLAGSGVRIALDAATTASATVASLRRLPVDQLTADASDPAGLELVRALGHALGTRTVVNGVSTAEQLDRLREIGVAAARGAVIAEPMSINELTAWLAARPALLQV